MQLLLSVEWNGSGASIHTGAVHGTGHWTRPANFLLTLSSPWHDELAPPGNAGAGVNVCCEQRLAVSVSVLRDCESHPSLKHVETQG